MVSRPASGSVLFSMGLLREPLSNEPRKRVQI